MTTPNYAIYQHMPSYEQMAEQNRLLAGIHASLVKNVQEDDYEAIKRIIVNGGGRSAFPVGTVLHTIKGNYDYPWMFVHHGQHQDGRHYAHLRVMKAIDQLQFDAPEAFYYASEGLAAGTYYFNIPTALSSTPTGNYKFTLANAVPAGGRLTVASLYDATLVGKTVSVYDAANATTASQTATVESGSDGTYLGLLQAGGDAEHPNMNSCQRARYGSNNWAQSNIRQYFNSAAAAGSVWKSSNKFDMPPSWNASQPGFLSKLPQGFIDIVNPVTVGTVTNGVFEVDYSKSSSYTTKDKFWLPSRYQVYGSTEGSDLSEEQWDYYKGSADIDKIMYDNGGTARPQFLRSPITSYAYVVRYVNASTGALSSYSANNAYAEAPACEISEILLSA